MKELFNQHQFHEGILPATPRMHQRFYETTAVSQKPKMKVTIPLRRRSEFSGHSRFNSPGATSRFRG
jgi:hypothetical protein